MTDWSKILTTGASIISILFGIWHFSVPKKWKWKSYINPEATELILAIRAINIFFSLSLVLFGTIILLLIHLPTTHRNTLIIILSALSILWATRIILQIFYPQGTMSPLLKYGMLCSFTIVWMAYSTSLFLIILL